VVSDSLSENICLAWWGEKEKVASVVGVNALMHCSLTLVSAGREEERGREGGGAGAEHTLWFFDIRALL
jgi:hypothetical protein